MDIIKPLVNKVKQTMKLEHYVSMLYFPLFNKLWRMKNVVQSALMIHKNLELAYS